MSCSSETATVPIRLPVKNLVKSLKEIQSINEPNSGNIKLLEEYLFELIKIQQILKKLKLDVMSHDNNS